MIDRHAKYKHVRYIMYFYLFKISLSGFIIIVIITPQILLIFFKKRENFINYFFTIDNQKKYKTLNKVYVKYKDLNLFYFLLLRIKYTK